MFECARGSQKYSPLKWWRWVPHVLCSSDSLLHWTVDSALCKAIKTAYELLISTTLSKVVSWLKDVN